MGKNKTIHRLETPNYHIDIGTSIQEVEKVKKILEDVNIRFVDSLVRRRR